MNYSSELVETVRRLKGARKTNKFIAGAVGLPVESVARLCRYRKIKRPSEGRVEISLGPKLMEVLQAEADRRETRLPTFLRRLLLTISTDKMFDAILDDGITS